jgi:hypothetical protein
MKKFINTMMVATLFIASLSVPVKAELDATAVAEVSSIKAFFAGFGALGVLGALGVAIHKYGVVTVTSALTAATAAAGAWVLLNKAAASGAITKWADAMSYNFCSENSAIAITPVALAGAVTLGSAAYYAMYNYLYNGPGTQTVVTRQQRNITL